MTLTNVDAEWLDDRVFLAPRWLTRVSASPLAEGARADYFTALVEHFTALDALRSTLDPQRPVAAQLEHLARRHPKLRELQLASREPLDTHALAPLPLDQFVTGLKSLGKPAWGAGLGQVRSLELHSREPKELPSPKQLASLRSCETVALHRLEVNAALVDALASMPKLRALELHGCVVADHALEKLTTAPIERLVCTGAPLPAKSAAAVVAIKSLRVAALTVASARDGKALAPLQREGVSLCVSVAGAIPLTDELVAELCDALPNVHGFSLDKSGLAGLTRKLSAEGLAPLRGLKELRWLRLDNLCLKGLTAEHLPFAATERLEVLSLRAVAKLNAKAFDALSSLRTLRELDLRRLSVTDAAVKQLSALPLRKLALSECKLGAKAFAALGAMNSLRSLSVRQPSGYSDAMLAALAPADALQELTLESATGAPHPQTLSALAKLRSLRSLAVQKTGYQDAWMASLAGSASLSDLRFARGDSPFSPEPITDEGARSALAVRSLRTIHDDDFEPSAAVRAEIEEKGHGAWVPGRIGVDFCVSDFAVESAFDAT